MHGDATWNHKDELPLIHFVPTLPHHFCCPVSILIYLFFVFLSSLSILNFLPPHGSFSNRLRQVHCSLWPEIYYFLSQAPKLKGLHYPSKLGQCTTAHFPGAYLGIKCGKMLIEAIFNHLLIRKTLPISEIVLFKYKRLL